MNQEQMKTLTSELVLMGTNIWKIYLDLMHMDNESKEYQEKMEHLSLVREYEDKLYARIPREEVGKLSSFFENRYHLQPISLTDCADDKLTNIFPFYRVFFALHRISTIEEVPYPFDLPESTKHFLKEKWKEVQFKAYFSDYYGLLYLLLNQENPQKFYQLLFFNRTVEKENLSRSISHVTLLDAYDYLNMSPTWPDFSLEERKEASLMYKEALNHFGYYVATNKTGLPSKEYHQFLLACFFSLLPDDQDDILTFFEQFANSNKISHEQRGILFKFMVEIQQKLISEEFKRRKKR